MPKKILSLFSTTLYTGQLPSAAVLNRGLLKDVEEHAKLDKMGREWSKTNYPGGFTSYASLSDMHHRTPGFAKFEELLHPHAKGFAKLEHWEMRGLTLKMTACWFNIMPKHTHHALHNHPQSVLSGAYYLSVPKGSTAIKFEDPRAGLFMNAPSKKRPSLFHEVTPKAGAFVLFESWLRHEVPPNQSGAPRISISFNYSLQSEE